VLWKEYRKNVKKAGRQIRAAISDDHAGRTHPCLIAANEIRTVIHDLERELLEHRCGQ
jgi:hypothetical protein